jgi:pSer/pThr/pTyr-binding forkhead associated (FHA) protein
MGSTNGTYLNRRKVTAPIQVNRGDTARIGKTQMEFKR